MAQRRLATRGVSGLRTALVVGAEDRRGLAVIHGLGRAGVRVIACGTTRHSIGFFSRFTRGRHLCASPVDHPARARDELLSLVKRVRPDVVIPATEPTLVALSQIRADIEPIAVLAAPPATTLEYALDASLVIRLAERFAVPVPHSIEGDSAARILGQVEELRFPVLVTRRGAPPGAPVVAYTLRELQAALDRLERRTDGFLVQEYLAGVGLGVVAVCHHGDPLTLFQYSRTREYPAAGGAAVLRTSEPVDPQVRACATTLLAATRWHGLAHLEFRNDRRARRFTLLRITAHFPGSTALCLDAGLNLPYLVARLHGDDEAPTPTGSYRAGVTARWLRGELRALAAAGFSRPALWQFLRGFRWGTGHDEFKLYDWRPGVVECGAAIAELARLVWQTSPRRETRPAMPPLERTAAGAGTRARAVLPHRGL